MSYPFEDSNPIANLGHNFHRTNINEIEVDTIYKTDPLEDEAVFLRRMHDNLHTTDDKLFFGWYKP